MWTLKWLRLSHKCVEQKQRNPKHWQWEIFGSLYNVLMFLVRVRHRIQTHQCNYTTNGRWQHFSPSHHNFSNQITRNGGHHNFQPPSSHLPVLFPLLLLSTLTLPFCLDTIAYTYATYPEHPDRNALLWLPYHRTYPQQSDSDSSVATAINK